LSYPNDALSDDIDALISGADALSAAADSIGTITSGSDVLVSNFDHVGEVFDNLQAFLSELKSGHFYTPVGALMPFAGLSAYVPSGWLVCDGRSYAASGASADLQTILSAAGFSALPDLQGRTIIGVGTGSGLTARALAANIGAETHTLDVTQIPNHKHYTSGTTGDDSPDHSHAFTDDSLSATNQGTQLASGSFYGRFSFAATATPDGTAGASTRHQHGFGAFSNTSIYNNSDVAQTVNQPHNNMQPSLVLNYIIKN